jgi:hypothetical protein
VIDPVGRVIAHSESRAVPDRKDHEEQAAPVPPEHIDAEAHFMKGSRTGYEIWGDLPWWAATVAIAVMAVYSRRDRRWRWRLAS